MLVKGGSIASCNSPCYSVYVLWSGYKLVTQISTSIYFTTCSLLLCHNYRKFHTPRGRYVLPYLGHYNLKTWDTLLGSEMNCTHVFWISYMLVMEWNRPGKRSGRRNVTGGRQLPTAAITISQHGGRRSRYKNIFAVHAIIKHQFLV